MSLMDVYNTTCVLLVRSNVKDGLGGWKQVYTAGDEFIAAWEYESAPEITVAEQQGVERTYMIYVDKTLSLDYHDTFRRADNGQIYRVTNPGTDRFTPGFSPLNKRVIEVEKWKLPTDAEVVENVQSGAGA